MASNKKFPYNQENIISLKSNFQEHELDKLVIPELINFKQINIQLYNTICRINPLIISIEIINHTKMKQIQATTEGLLHNLKFSYLVLFCIVGKEIINASTNQEINTTTTFKYNYTHKTVW